MTTTIVSTDDELQRLGITRVHLEHFHWGGFRYTQVRDAIAAAKRGAAR